MMPDRLGDNFTVHAKCIRVEGIGGPAPHHRSMRAYEARVGGGSGATLPELMIGLLDCLC